MTATTVWAGGEWLRQFAPAAAGAPLLVCFPHAGGSASFFAPLARALAPAVRVLAVQYPGRLDRRREPAIEDLRELARRGAMVIAESAGPAASLGFFGHSMGSLVAYETALLGEREGGPVPGVLFASGGRAPALTRVATSILADDRFLIDEVLRLGGTAPELLDDEDLRELVLPALRADYRALRDYRAEPETRIGCPITALVGEHDPVVSIDDAHRWRDHTRAGFRLKTFPGDHFYLNTRLPDLVAAVQGGLPAAGRPR